MTQIGGDYYDFHVVDKNKIGIFIADVSGHGIPAAIIASMLKVAFSIQSAFADDPSRLLSRINKSMLNNVGMNFITASYIFLDLETNTIKHARAGHPSIYIHSSETDEVKEFNQKGKLLGLFPEIHSETVEFSIQKGDRIVLYTDGIIDFVQLSIDPILSPLRLNIFRMIMHVKLNFLFLNHSSSTASPNPVLP